MSHNTRIKTELRDLGCLRKAAKELGFTKFREKSAWAGYGGGMTRNKADLVMSHPSSRYEVGVVKQADGTYTINTDFYGNIGSIIGADAKILIQEWTKQTAIEAAQFDGFMVEEQVEEHTGTIRLKCTHF
ncbi:MAG: hypothetical protein AMS21_01140 [Gemmatimonas sp. SG8_38_2]|nr:MAG: hypothetical protein AMS21_01140 [Gemmatimonas sp. SG8_38_2]